jgi:spore coat polysaccharide biosynthesis protein SpsF
MGETEQEVFWKGDFGDDYIDRNTGDLQLASNIALFAKILANLSNIKSAIEFGCNAGLNLRAINHLIPDIELHGIEINKKAIEIIKKWDGAEITEGSILDVEIDRKYDLTLSKGVLIHINPERLEDVYRKLYEYSNKYICIAEYYNPRPVEVNYRGHSGRLFKRDFAGELMDLYPDLELVNYGFAYHRDSQFKQDDITWFLMRKYE